ncbi:hypothetical protein [Konateibacter massiliensis]|uniref:hypothetical protein n=1 Tax=Konateibacter massiliensis TaxID=2002841 RepID=UPI000C14C194|nr:hypothetical protein [Konateibacter massiliensis]
MSLDLWNFNEKTLKNRAAELPNNILREQADILSDKTGGIIYGKISNRKFKPKDTDIQYNLATEFNVVVPLLDNYSYNLLILYSKPESDYPIAITVGSNVVDDAEDFNPQYECSNQKEFIESLKSILSSDEVNKNIEILYSKASF